MSPHNLPKQVTVLNKKIINCLLFIAFIATVTNVHAWGEEEKAWEEEEKTFSKKLERNLDKMRSEPQYSMPIQTLTSRIAHLKESIEANSLALKEASMALDKVSDKNMSSKPYRTALYTKGAAYNRLHRSVRHRAIMLAQLEVLNILPSMIKPTTSEKNTILILHHVYSSPKALVRLALHLEPYQTGLDDPVKLLETSDSKAKKRAKQEPSTPDEFHRQDKKLLQGVISNLVNQKYDLFCV